MLIKEEYIYQDGSLSYSLRDNIDKVEVGYSDKDRCNFVKVYKKGEDPFNINVVDSNIYICNDNSKTIQVVRPR